MIDNKNGARQQNREQQQQPSRKLRSRQKKARYNEELLDDEEDFFEERYFDVEEKLQCKSFANCQRNCVREMNGTDITFELFQRNGFQTPMVVKENKNNVLGMKIPSNSFTVDDVKACVGQRRILDVMDVETQKGKTMTMKEWCNYYNNNTENRMELLNVISLEFSHTKLEHFVDSPRIVKQMDWVDLVWPRYLKRMQKEGTNALHEMKYPKVQKYCLMSVKGCYTDFHIDFGGTSVWYHILRGRKIFWLIPPTETNIRSYEKWTLSGEQSKIFFGDLVEHCCRIELESGNTFFIPTGWIHAVYTKEDSLVFGGNFLHSFGIEKQLRVSQVEDVTRVESKYRYPFFIHLMWYVLVRYVHCLMGRNHLSVDDDGNSLPPQSLQSQSSSSESMMIEMNSTIEQQEIKKEDNENEVKLNDKPEKTEEEQKVLEMKTESHEDTEEKPTNNFNSNESSNHVGPFITFVPNEKIHLTKYEIIGLKKLIQWLSQKFDKFKREIRKSNEQQQQQQMLRNNLIPELIISPENLLDDARKMIEEHENDNQELAITNRPVLFWFTKKMITQLNKPMKMTKKSTSSTIIQQHQKIPIKRQQSPTNNDNSQQQQQQQRQVSLGTTLDYDLISSSSLLKGLIEQTDTAPCYYNYSQQQQQQQPQQQQTQPVSYGYDNSMSSVSTAPTTSTNGIRLEHNYNLNPSTYYNPYHPHNYAYHPYNSHHHHHVLPQSQPQQLPPPPPPPPPQQQQQLSQNVHYSHTPVSTTTYVYHQPQTIPASTTTSAIINAQQQQLPQHYSLYNNNQKIFPAASTYTTVIPTSQQPQPLPPPHRNVLTVTYTPNHQTVNTYPSTAATTTLMTRPQPRPQQQMIQYSYHQQPTAATIAIPTATTVHVPVPYGTIQQQQQQPQNINNNNNNVIKQTNNVPVQCINSMMLNSSSTLPNYSTIQTQNPYYGR
ncbi:lysine-specific demethylase 2b-like protein [Dermatophagoides farinae]|uniref:[histone H3]-dimethyl-L-lysine(36) demethylase n=1 Tax=Dermatophagoides farinae TaxID=6954 RepID=A0A9D4SCT8_DERFA|nr:lysine-specific demethylase 2b-like protein [Dermatophagoides farinae]